MKKHYKEKKLLAFLINYKITNTIYDYTNTIYDYFLII